MRDSRPTTLLSNNYPQTDIIKNIETLVKNLGVYGATFSDIRQHSPIADINKCLQAFKDAKADIIVSAGGGSAIDAAKIVISLFQKETRGEFVKQIAIPTTLSAAEYTVLVAFIVFFR
jgi:alcohol dehydrogenase class IV